MKKHFYIFIILIIFSNNILKADDISNLTELADKGDAIAQNNLGHYYLYRSDNNLENLDKIQYRITTDKYNFLRSYIYTFTGLSGLAVANVYNNQRPTVLNDYGIPRKDLVRYRQLFGIVIGLIFSSEVFDAVATLLTPTESVILSEAEFDRKNINK